MTRLPPTIAVPILLALSLAMWAPLLWLAVWWLT